MDSVVWVHRTMIVPDAIVEQARAVAAKFGSAASGMWTTALSPTGALPATHWISTGLIDEQFAGMLSAPGALQAGAAALGVTIDLMTCEALLAVADVSADEPFAVMERLGLKLIDQSIEM